MEKNPFAFNGAIFSTIKKVSKSGKEYIPGEAMVEGKKYLLYVYERESKAGKKYLSIIGNEVREDSVVHSPVQPTILHQEPKDSGLIDEIPF